MTKHPHPTEPQTEEQKAQVAPADPKPPANTTVAAQPEAGLPSTDVISMDEFESDAGAGRQGVTASDMATPIIYILQAGSPQCKKSDPKYIQGAAEGMFYNNVTNEIYDGEKGIQVLPCFFEKVFIEWKPKRGGFVAIHDAKDPIKNDVKIVKNENGKDIPTLPSGNELVETNQHYVLIIREDNTFEPAVIAMASTALRSSKLWNTLMGQVTKKNPTTGRVFIPATFATLWRLKTIGRQKGDYSWATWAIEKIGEVTSTELYRAGKALEQAVSAGTIRVKQEHVSEHEPAGAAANAAGSSKDYDDEIPF